MTCGRFSLRTTTGNKAKATSFSVSSTAPDFLFRRYCVLKSAKTLSFVLKTSSRFWPKDDLWARNTDAAFKIIAESRITRRILEYLVMETAVTIIIKRTGAYKYRASRTVNHHKTQQQTMIHGKTANSLLRKDRTR